MTVEMLVGLQVIDDAGYQAYRQAMMPLLLRHGGEFGYDFVVSKVLRTRTPAPINRVFTICFAERDSMTAFFASEEYLEIKRRHFQPSVSDTTVLATYEVKGDG